MATLGLLASWAAALFGGWALVGGLAAAAPEHPVRASAERALVASAVGALVATGALLSLLLSGEVTISYVARSITTNLPPGYRLAALWNLPAGAVLPTAAFVAIAGRLSTVRTRSSLGTAAVGAIVLALSAASIAASPFSTLPWVPTEGLGISPELQHPLSVVGRVALSLAVASLAAHVAHAADDLARERPRGAGAREPMLAVALALTVLAMWSASQGSFAAGVAASPAPLLAWRGAMVPALVALVLARLSRPDRSTASFAVSLGALGLTSAVLLGATTRAASGWEQSVFGAVSLAATAVGATIAVARARASARRLPAVLGVVLLAAGAATSLWFVDADPTGTAPVTQWLLIAGGVSILSAWLEGGSPRARWRSFSVLAAAAAGAGLAALLAPSAYPGIGWSALAAASGAMAIARMFGAQTLPARLGGAFATLAVALAACGAAGEGWTREASATVAGGATAIAASPIGSPFVLAHQGISRFEDSNAHVEGVALEPTRDGRTLPLLSADRREYVDSRDELLAAATMRPAVLRSRFVELRVRVDAIAPDEQVQLQLSVVPFAAAWGLAVACVVLAAMIQFMPTAPASPPPPPVPAHPDIA